MIWPLTADSLDILRSSSRQPALYLLLPVYTFTQVVCKLLKDTSHYTSMWFTGRCSSNHFLLSAQSAPGVGHEFWCGSWCARYMIAPRTLLVTLKGTEPLERMAA
eukprot:COSAG02_NODE_319_length_24795_cov_20.998502_12_plen_105_part_00